MNEPGISNNLASLKVQSNWDTQWRYVKINEAHTCEKVWPDIFMHLIPSITTGIV